VSVRRSGYGTTKRGVARRAHVPLAVPLSGRRTVDKKLPEVADERTVLTERLAARIGIDRHSSSSPGISLAVVLRDLSRTYDADVVERR